MRTFLAILLVPILSFTTSAQATTGPDVTVSSLTDVGAYGQALNITAFAVGTVACNVGNQPVQWTSGDNHHPVIAQNMYRLLNGTYQQVGQSWLKHAFASTNSPGCGTCIQPPGGGSQLGVGCTDAYGSGLNGNQSLLGPRSEVNASTGYYIMPHGLPTGDPTIMGRLQVANADLGNAGAQYFVEAHYVTSDDALAGNKNNNATWQQIVTPVAGMTGNVAFIGAPHAQQPGIYAWQAADPLVVISTFDIPNDGRFLIAKRVFSLGGGNFHYELAVQNLNSDRSGRGFTVDFAPGTVISNPGFHSVPCHSGEPYSNTAWTNVINGSSINWHTDLASANLNANALRWGTMYSFSFNATAAVETNKTIEPFKPAPCPADPIVTPVSGYVLNTAAAFDNPTLTAPVAGPSGDDVSNSYPIGFTFSFYGTAYTSVNICTNGFLSFGAPDATYTNDCFPTAATPNGVIAPYWDDLLTAPNGAGSVSYQTLGVAPNRRFVAFWNGIGLYANAASHQSFKAILDETTNKITTTIISSADGGASATRGIERQDGLAGVLASCSAAGSAVANTSQTYVPVASVLPSADLSVTGNFGPNGLITMNINSVARIAPVVLVASLDPGPLNLGPLGVINLGLTPGQYVVVADGAGALQAANPADFTDWYCGDYQIQIPLGPGGLPPGMTIYVQGVVISTTSNPPPPNGAFHITTEVTINT